MQTIGIKQPSSDGSGDGPADSPSGRDALYLLAGAGTVMGGAGLVLVLTDAGSPLRGPLALFFLLAAPGAAFAAALRGLDPWARGLVSVTGALTVVMLVAQGMLATHHWSVEGGVITVGALSALAFLLQCILRFHRRSGGFRRIRWIRPRKRNSIARQNDLKTQGHIPGPALESSSS